MTSLRIQVDHVTRLEGHGNIVAMLREGKVAKAIFQVVEANRFFESILLGQTFDQVAHIASRICGICAVSHSCASLQATENALGIEISQQTKLLRRLLMNGEQLSSHALHVYFLAAPDFLNLDSVLGLLKADPEAVDRAFRVKNTAYAIGKVVAGRHTHPIACVPGGFTAIPSAEALSDLRGRLAALWDDLWRTVELYRELEIPDFQRDTEYVCLRQGDGYTFYGGRIASSDGDSVAPKDYPQAISEYVVTHSTAKHARWHRDSYMVGALARLNNNWAQLRPEARQAMAALELKPPCRNPFMNTVAQLIEMVHCLADSIATIDEILGLGLRAEDVGELSARAGRGVGVVEAPRGLLIHDYTYDEQGRCTGANCVIPTGQNLANLDADMRAYLAEIVDRPEQEIRKGLEMLVRAYDPCISCSAH